MDLGHDGARVLITGGGANIGRGISLAFAREGARVLVVDVDAEQAETVAALAREAGAADAVSLGLDLTKDGAGARAVGAAVDAWGGLDVLVNNVGWSRPGFFSTQTDRSLWQRTVDLNLFTAIDCTQNALPLFRQGGGAVVFLASDSAGGVVRQGVYGATKAGIVALSRTVAREEGRYGVRSNVIAPGLVLPPDSEAVGRSSVWADGRDALFDDSQLQHVLTTQALRRRTTPEDVANAVIWVASPVAARQVTGQTVAVGGGSYMP